MSTRLRISVADGDPPSTVSNMAVAANRAIFRGRVLERCTLVLLSLRQKVCGAFSRQMAGAPAHLQVEAARRPVDVDYLSGEKEIIDDL